MLSKNKQKLLLLIALLFPFAIAQAVDQEPNLEDNRGCGCGGVPSPRPRPKPKPNPNQTPQRPHPDSKLALHNFFSNLFNKTEEEISKILTDIPQEIAKELPAIEAALKDLQGKVGPELEKLLINYGPLLIELIKIIITTV